MEESIHLLNKQGDNAFASDEQPIPATRSTQYHSTGGDLKNGTTVKAGVTHSNNTSADRNHKRFATKTESGVTSNSSFDDRTTTTISRRRLLRLLIDRDGVHFGVRMAVCMTTASLFILLRQPGKELVPEAMWIVITVLFVCWFPSLDAASVVEKSIQRLYGTAMGALTGIGCGFVSLVILYFGNYDMVQDAVQDTLDILQDEELTINSTQQQDVAVVQQELQEADQNVFAQSVFIIACIAVYTFLVCWAAVQYKVGGAKIIDRYNYACILSLLTFYICLLPFYSDQEPKWTKAIYRVTDVVMGCLMGAFLSITILPRSTVRILRHKMERKITLAGEASQAVLYYAADSFSENAYVVSHHEQEKHEEEQSTQQQAETDDTKSGLGYLEPIKASVREHISHSRRPWRNQPQGASGSNGIHNDTRESMDGDEKVLQKYESAIQDWRNIKTQLSILRYDPFNLGTPDYLLTKFETEMTHTLARALRIQNTVILLYGIVRNDPKHNFSEVHIHLFAQVGTLIRDMLAVQTGDSRINERACAELKTKLSQIRGFIIELSAIVAKSPSQTAFLTSQVDLQQMIMVVEDNDNTTGGMTSETTCLLDQDDIGGRGAPKFVQGSRVCALLFLQLVEHLALRSIRLHQTWKQCKSVCIACEKRDVEPS